MERHGGLSPAAMVCDLPLSLRERGVPVIVARQAWSPWTRMVASSAHPRIIPFKGMLRNESEF